jgi:hypothetical protein
MPDNMALSRSYAEQVSLAAADRGEHRGTPRIDLATLLDVMKLPWRFNAGG